jgi:hypothetical protein
MAEGFSLSEVQFEQISWCSPADTRCVARVDYRRVISSIMHVLQSGGQRKSGAEAQAIGRSRGGRTTKIHAAGGEYGWPRRLIIRAGDGGDVAVALDPVGQMTPRLRPADAAYRSEAIRGELMLRGTTPVIPNYPTRKRMHPSDRTACRMINIIGRMSPRLQDFSHIVILARVPTRWNHLVEKNSRKINGLSMTLSQKWFPHLRVML